MRACLYACMYVCMYVHAHVRACVCMYVRMCVCMYVTVYIHAYKLLSFWFNAYDQICQKAQPLITSMKVICLYYQKMTFRKAKAYSQILENIVFL